jgi:hypothetical protein
MDRYLAAISAAISTRWRRCRRRTGRTTEPAHYQRRYGDLGRPNSYWVDPARRMATRTRAVLVADRAGQGSIAIVWAPYEFWIDGASHCGIDVQHQGRRRWRRQLVWTVTGRLSELKPADPAGVNPAG